MISSPNPIMTRYQELGSTLPRTYALVRLRFTPRGVAGVGSAALLASTERRTLTLCTHSAPLYVIILIMIKIHHVQLVRIGTNNSVS